MSNLLETLNGASLSDALEVLEPLVERSAWVAEQAIGQRPFASSQDVAQTLVNVILETKFTKRVELFRAHPELAGREASTGTMTAASISEQGRLGLLTLSAKDARRLQDLNARYAERFGHPYIVALHRVPDLEFLFETFERRLTASSVEEHVSTLAEIASVIYARCAKTFNDVTQRPACATREADNV